MQFLRGAEETRRTWHGKLTRSIPCSTSIWHVSPYCIFARRTSKKNGRLPERENRPGMKLFSTPVLPRDVMRRIFLYPSCLDKSGAWETPEISTRLSPTQIYCFVYRVCLKLDVPSPDSFIVTYGRKDYTERLKVVRFSGGTNGKANVYTGKEKKG